MKIPPKLLSTQVVSMPDFSNEQIHLTPQERLGLALSKNFLKMGVQAQEQETLWDDRMEAAEEGG